jgi:hypothetical protein
MPEQNSELVEISKLNGDFKRNYGKIIGAYLQRRARPVLALERLCGHGFDGRMCLAGEARYRVDTSGMIRRWIYLQCAPSDLGTPSASRVSREVADTIFLNSFSISG